MGIREWTLAVAVFCMGFAGESVWMEEKAGPTGMLASKSAASDPGPRDRWVRPDSFLTVRTTDLTPRFLDFFRAADQPGVGPEERWALWRERYGFAAVPPTAQGMAMARRQLDESWSAYPRIMDRIQAGPGGMEPEPATILERVAQVLELDELLDVEIVIFVGTGRSAAFSMALGKRWQVALPVEQAPARREIAASHEFAHAVHGRMAGLEGNWNRSVGQLVLGEGLAMHVAEMLFPGRPAGAYVGSTPQWMEVARGRQVEILRGVMVSVDNATPAAMDRFIRGPGPAGLDREAYFAGWVLVEHLLDSDWTLPGLARVPRGLMARVVEEGLADILEENR